MDLKLSVFQVCSTDSFEENAKKVLGLLGKEAKASDLAVFPENALYINIAKNDAPPQLSLKESFFVEAAEFAKKNQTVLHLGSLPIYKDKKIYNTSLVIDAQGKIHKFYNKIHLFKAFLGKALSIDESANYEAGDQPAILEHKGWKIGLSICFDLRFSELYSFYAKKSCDLILVPSAFFRKTGQAHWEVLLRARAIETQAYVAAPGQVGTHHSSDGESIRKSYGHSLTINPWGEVLSDLGGQEEGVFHVDLSKDKIKEVRDMVVMERRL